MSAPNPFRPPESSALQVSPRTPPPAKALATATLIQLLWSVGWTPRYLELVQSGAARPIGLLFALAGLVCLYVTVLRMALRLRVGVTGFVLAIGWLIPTLWAWRDLSLVGLAPFIFAAVVAAEGWRVVRACAQEQESA